MKKLELEKAEIENILKRNSGNERFIHLVLKTLISYDRTLYRKSKEAQA